MNTPSLPVWIPITLIAVLFAAVAGGYYAGARTRASRYAPRVLVAVSAGLSLTLLLLATVIGGVLALPVLIAVAAFDGGAAVYIRNKWVPEENGVGAVGERYRSRWGFAELRRELRSPSWETAHLAHLDDALINQDGSRCIVGRRLDGHNQPTADNVTVRLGMRHSGIVGLIAGKPDMGKTTTALRILAAVARAANHGAIIVLDPKRDVPLRQGLVAIAASLGVPFWEWSEEDPLDPLSSTMTSPHLAVPAAIERLMATEEWTESYYENLTRGAWMDAADLVQLAGLPLSLPDMIDALLPNGSERLLKQAATRARAGAANPDVLQRMQVQHDVRSANRWKDLEGAAERLRGLARSGLGSRLRPEADGGRTIASLASTPGVVYLPLDSGMWPETSKRFAELLVVGLMQDAGTVAESGRLVTIFADELGAIPARRLDALVQRGRGAGFSFIGALQTLSALSANDPVLAAQFTGTLTWAIAHTVSGQADGGEDDAERFARMAGTRNERELTTQTAGGFLALPTGVGSARQVDSYVMGPNEFKSLPKACAAVIDLSVGTEHPGRVSRAGIVRHVPTVPDSVAGTPWSSGPLLLGPGPTNGYEF